MNSITARRRHPLARYAVILLALCLVGGAYALLSPAGDRADAAIASGKNDDVANGKALFEANCSSCHGLNGRGRAGQRPVADRCRSGRGRLPGQHRPHAGGEQHRCAGAAEGPARVGDPGGDRRPGGVRAVAGRRSHPCPTADMVDPAKGDPAKGGELFRANCIQCHNWVGAGGALTEGKHAPSLNKATPTQIYEAMITGPQAMPEFNDSTITPEQKRDMIAYIVKVREQVDPGGSGLGRIGPVTEGLVAWIVGIGLLVPRLHLDHREEAGEEMSEREDTGTPEERVPQPGDRNSAARRPGGRHDGRRARRARHHGRRRARAGARYRRHLPGPGEGQAGRAARRAAVPAGLPRRRRVHRARTWCSRSATSTAPRCRTWRSAAR